MSIGFHLPHVLRRLGLAPGFSLVAILTIGLGVGANTALFSVIHTVLLMPLPYPQPDALISVWKASPVLKVKELEMSPADYFIFREQNRSFSSMGMWRGGMAAITGKGVPEQVRSVWSTEGTLAALGIEPMLGRAFTARDTEPDAADSVILSHGLWQRKFSGDAGVVGSRILVDGRPRQVIGIMPAHFHFLEEKPDLLMPLRFHRAKTYLGNYSYRGIARLKPGVTLPQANADIARLIPIALASFPPPPGFSAKLFQEARIQAALKPLRDDVIGELGKVLWLLMGSIGVVLLIACANVANLLLVRGEGRQHEIAVRLALGASTGRIAAELLVESVLLGLLGGAAGLGLAWGGLRLLVWMTPASLPRLDEIGIGPVAILFTLAISLVAGLLFGLVPVLKYAGPNMTQALRGGGRALSQSRERHRARNVLVVVQTALALVLLIASGLMVRTFQSLRQAQPGFRPAGLQTFRIFIPEASVKDEERVIRQLQEIQRRLGAIPGVASTAFGNSIPTDGNRNSDVLYAEDRVYAEGQVPPLRRFKFVSPGYFQTLKTPLVAGRDFTWSDLYNYRDVALVSENLAREMWREPGAALGKRIREGMKDPWREIIGVVADVSHDGVDQKAPTTVYCPVLMDAFWGSKFAQRAVVFALRTSRAGTQSLMEQVRQAVWSVQSEVPLATVRTMQEAYRASMARSSFALVMLAIAGGLALLIGVVGIYGVISYAVSQRRRELGIRIALGAQSRVLRSMVVRQGLVLASIGVAIGLAIAAGLTRLMSALLFQVSPVDGLTYAAVSAGVLLAAALASYLPARRASSVDPIEALRAQ
jgi:putative ABC transport system permease protein